MARIAKIFASIYVANKFVTEFKVRRNFIFIIESLASSTQLFVSLRFDKEIDAKFRNSRIRRHHFLFSILYSSPSPRSPFTLFEKNDFPPRVYLTEWKFEVDNCSSSSRDDPISHYLRNGSGGQGALVRTLVQDTCSRLPAPFFVQKYLPIFLNDPFWILVSSNLDFK